MVLVIGGSPTDRTPPPPPPLVSGVAAFNIRARPLFVRPAIKPVVVSAAPTKYMKPESSLSDMDEELNTFLSEIKREEEEMKRTKRMKLDRIKAKVMADTVRASTVVSIQPVQSNYLDDYGLGKPKKEKKNKKLIRMAGGQTWEDPSLVEWEDGMYISC